MVVVGVGGGDPATAEQHDFVGLEGTWFFAEGLQL